MTVRRDRKTDARGIRLGAALLAVCLLAVACLSGTGCSVIFITAEEQSRNAASSAAEGTTARQDDEPTGKKRIAFTFDDGPQAPAENLDAGYYPYTTYVLDKVEALQKAGHRANVTFFVVGSRAAEYPSHCAVPTRWAVRSDRIPIITTPSGARIRRLLPIR